jgi:hypothetical protein
MVGSSEGTSIRGSSDAAMWTHGLMVCYGIRGRNDVSTSKIGRVAGLVDFTVNSVCFH